MNEFYDQKLEELEKRLSLLTENVVTSLREKYQDPNKSAKPQRKGEERTPDPDFVPISPLPASGKLEAKEKKKHGSLPSVDWREIVARITKTQRSSLSDHDKESKLIDVDELDADDPDSLVRDKSEVKKIAEADSIQRALVDQYRTAKLLHNFAIMNYTGFIKIAKKHDKTLPHRKGRFKTLTKASNICDEGKAVERLAQRLELRYANWFCEGNHREAIAQLLPKRGDGLETDWSQLRYVFFRRCFLSSVQPCTF